MRIVLIGQAAFGQKVLEALLNRGEQVAAVYVPPDKPGSRIDPLKESAQQHGIPVFQPQRMRDPGVYEKFVELAPDLGVMAFVTDIVPESILNCPRLGTIQYHPSLLPKHRGRSSINWAIINGDKKTGITILWPDAGIDTGPILLQKEAEISPTDTVGSLYYDKLFPLGVEAIMESIDLIHKGKGSQDTPGRVSGHLRTSLPGEGCRYRLGSAHSQGLQSDSRHKSPARRHHLAAWPETQDIRL